MLIVKISLLIVSVFIFISCSSGSDSLGYQECIDDGGEVILENNANGTSTELCSIKKVHQFDDGEHEMEEVCPLDDYYNGTCDADAEDDKESTILGAPALRLANDNSKFVYTLFHDKVLEIMTKVSDTGYAHNSNNNFSLVPNYTDLNTTHDKYNLFLDCSGFVGHYIVQGLAPKLYSDVSPSNYSCQNRPLAADFADAIKDSPEASDDNPAATIEDLTNDQICWGQVKDIKNAQPGDILVYKHSNNINSKNVFCTNPDTNITRSIHTVDGNTGHILFIMEEPKESNRCKDNTHSCGKSQKYENGEWQYVVTVADSTTAKHMSDTRDHGVKGSDFTGHSYHAWAIDETNSSTQGEKTGIVQKCSDGTYSANCSSVEKNITITTKHKDHATGIGIGKMYVSEGMDGYRNSYSISKTTKAEVYIGRPLKCQ